MKKSKNTIYETLDFSEWLDSLRDARAKARIMARIDRAANNNFGLHKALGDGISEMKIDSGPGYRLYYAQEGPRIYLLLLGGDKASQRKDIAKANKIWQRIKGGQ